MRRPLEVLTPERVDLTPNQFQAKIEKHGLQEWAYLFTDARDKGTPWETGYLPNYEGNAEFFADESIIDNLKCGYCAWIDSKGRVIPVQYSSHRLVADFLLGGEPKAEQYHAKVTIGLSSVRAMIAYVQPNFQTPEMKRAILSFTRKHKEHYPELRRNFSD